MSGISGVTGKMKPEVSAQRDGWGRGLALRLLYRHAVGHPDSAKSDEKTLGKPQPRPQCPDSESLVSAISLRIELVCMQDVKM